MNETGQLAEPSRPAGPVPFGSGPEWAPRLILKVVFHNQSLQGTVFICFSYFKGSL